MKMSRQRAILFAMCWAGCAQAALASDSRITLVVSGQAWDGPPQFAVAFDGKPVGQGTVAAAIDAETAGLLSKATDRTPYVQSFTFTLPEADFRTDGAVTVQFLNAMTQGKPGTERALYLSAVLVNGRAVTASGVRVEGPGATGAPALVGEFVQLASADATAITRAPEGGWPLPLDTDPVTTGATTVLATAPSPAATLPVKVAARSHDKGCDLDEVYNVVGFNENSNAITPALAERLDQVAADIGTRRCHVRLTGYASLQGAIDANALFAVERAQNALRYLEQKGVRFLSATAAGGGATTQFGDALRANRRVVIAVSP